MEYILREYSGVPSIVYFLVDTKIPLANFGNNNVVRGLLTHDHKRFKLLHMIWHAFRCRVPSKEPNMSRTSNIQRYHNFCSGARGRRHDRYFMREVRQQLLQRFEQQRDQRKKSAHLPLFLLILLVALTLSTSLVVVYAYKASIPISRLLVVGAMHHDHVRFREVAFLNKFKLYGAYEDYMDALKNQRQQQQNDIAPMKSDDSAESNPSASNSAAAYGSEQYSLFANRGRYINIPMAVAAPVADNDVGTGKVMHQSRGTGFNLYSVVSTPSSNIVSENTSPSDPECVTTDNSIGGGFHSDNNNSNGLQSGTKPSIGTVCETNHGFGISNTCDTLNDSFTNSVSYGSEQVTGSSLDFAEIGSQSGNSQSSVAPLSYPEYDIASRSSNGSQRDTAPTTATFKETISAYGSVRNPLNGYDLSSNSLLNGYVPNDPSSHTKSGRESQFGDSRAALKSLNGEQRLDSSSSAKFPQGPKTLETAACGTIRNPLNGYDLSSNSLMKGAAQNGDSTQVLPFQHGDTLPASKSSESIRQNVPGLMNGEQPGFTSVSAPSVSQSSTKTLETVMIGAIRNPLNGYDLTSNSLLDSVAPNDASSPAVSDEASQVGGEFTIKATNVQHNGSGRINEFQSGATPPVVKAMDNDNSVGAIRNPLNGYDLSSNSLLNYAAPNDDPSPADSGRINEFQSGATPPNVKATDAVNSVDVTGNSLNDSDVSSNSLLNYVASNDASSPAVSGEPSQLDDSIFMIKTANAEQNNFSCQINEFQSGVTLPNVKAMDTENAFGAMRNPWNGYDLSSNSLPDSVAPNDASSPVVSGETSQLDGSLFTIKTANVERHNGSGRINEFQSGAPPNVQAMDMNDSVGAIRNPLNGYDLGSNSHFSSPSVSDEANLLGYSISTTASSNEAHDEKIVSPNDAPPSMSGVPTSIHGEDKLWNSRDRVNDASIGATTLDVRTAFETTKNPSHGYDLSPFGKTQESSQSVLGQTSIVEGNAWSNGSAQIGNPSQVTLPEVFGSSDHLMATKVLGNEHPTENLTTLKGYDLSSYTKSAAQNDILSQSKSVEVSSLSGNAAQNVPSQDMLFAVSGPSGSSATTSLQPGTKSSATASSDISVDVGFITNPLNGYDLNASFKSSALLKSDAPSQIDNESTERSIAHCENIVDPLSSNLQNLSTGSLPDSIPSSSKSMTENGNTGFLIDPSKRQSNDDFCSLSNIYQPFTPGSTATKISDNVHVKTVEPSNGFTSSLEVKGNMNLSSTLSGPSDFLPLAFIQEPSVVPSYYSDSPLASSYEPSYFGNFDTVTTDTKFCSTASNDGGLALPSVGKTTAPVMNESTSADTTIRIPSEFVKSNEHIEWGINKMGSNRILGDAVDLYERSFLNVGTTDSAEGSLEIDMGNFLVQNNRFFEEAHLNTLSEAMGSRVEPVPSTNFNIGVNRFFDKIVDSSVDIAANVFEEIASRSPENFYMVLNRFDQIPSDSDFINDTANASPDQLIFDLENGTDSTVFSSASEPNVLGQNMLQGSHVYTDGENLQNQSVVDFILLQESDFTEQASNRECDSEIECAKHGEVHRDENAEQVSDIHSSSTPMNVCLDSFRDLSSRENNTLWQTVAPQLSCETPRISDCLENVNYTIQDDRVIFPESESLIKPSTDTHISTNTNTSLEILQDVSSIQEHSLSTPVAPNASVVMPLSDASIEAEKLDEQAQPDQSSSHDLKSFPTPPGRIESSTSLNMHNEGPSGSEFFLEKSFSPSASETPREAVYGAEKVFGNVQPENHNPLDTIFGFVKPENNGLPESDTGRSADRTKYHESGGFADNHRSESGASNQEYFNRCHVGGGHEKPSFFQSQPESFRIHDDGSSGMSAAHFRGTGTGPPAPSVPRYPDDRIPSTENRLLSDMNARFSRYDFYVPPQHELQQSSSAMGERSFDRVPQAENPLHSDMNSRFSRSDFYVPAQDQVRSAATAMGERIFNGIPHENGSQYPPDMNTRSSHPEFYERPPEQARQPPPIWENMYSRGPVPTENQFLADMNTRFSRPDSYMHPQDHSQQGPAVNERSFQRAPQHENQYRPDMRMHPFEHAQQAPPTWERSFNGAPEHGHPYPPNRPAPVNENPLLPDMSTRFSGSNFYRHPQEQAQVQQASSQLWEPNHNDDRSMDDFLNDDSGFNRYRLSRNTAPIAPDKGSGPKEDFKKGR
jgi:hypothetical protein